MLSYLTIAVYLAIASSVLAAPVGMGESYMLVQRSGAGQLCGTNVRALVDNASCEPKTNVYIQTAPENAAITTKPLNSLAHGQTAQCDHVIELQLLDTVTRTSKFCDVLVAMIAYPSSEPKATIVQDIARIVSGKDNLNYLETEVNKKKGAAVTKVLKGGRPANDVVTQAAFNYLDVLAVQNPAKGIATEIDGEITKIIAAARNLLAGQTRPTNPRSRDANDVRYFKLNDALNAYNQAITVTAEFQKLLAADPHP